MELTRKLDAYRVKHGLRRPEPPQATLPFPTAGPGSAAAAAPPATKPAYPAQNSRLTERRPPVKIFVRQSEIPFPMDVIPSPNHALVPVAGMARRTMAWLADMGIVGICWGMFLGLLTVLGVSLTARKIDLAVCLAMLFLLYTQYFGLFTAFGGITPGMRTVGLRVVSFDGNPPTPKQLLWRSFGYLVAGGALCLGFFWALWDDNHLCWQDRASQTYLTSLPLVPVPETQPARAGAEPEAAR